MVRLDMASPHCPSTPHWLPQNGERLRSGYLTLTAIAQDGLGRAWFSNPNQAWALWDECLSQNVIFMTYVACVIMITVAAYAVLQQTTEQMSLPPG